MTGGNDGLNTVHPYADDLFPKFRPTLRQTKDQVIRLDDHVGLNSSMGGFRSLWDEGKLAVIQGVGYPNPDRSHFEAMDIWHSADPKRVTPTGWLGRASGELDNKSGGVPSIHVGQAKLPLALNGSAVGGSISIGEQNTFRLEMGDSNAGEQKARRKLLEDVSASAGAAGSDELLSFVQRRQVQTLTAVDNLRELLEGPNAVRRTGYYPLMKKLNLVAGLIAKGFGTRVFYVSIDGFDTHAQQAGPHGQLLTELADSISNFFQALKASGDADRVRVMTFSEFGRRVQENGSRGTDHGAASCMFVAGSAMKGGVVGKHPSLADLDDGDLKYHTDFRRVYATLLDSWMGCDSKAVLGQKWEHVAELKKA